MDWQFKIGLGVAIVFALLPYVVKGMPPPISWGGIVVGVLLIIWALLPHHERIPMGPALLFVASIGAVLASVLWYLASTKPAVYPQVMVMFRANRDPGPYALLFDNTGTGPLINVSLSIRDATAFPGASLFKIGDIEVGGTPLTSVPSLPLGYYQIDIRGRDVSFTEMLQIAMVNGEPRQFIWLSDWHKLLLKPKGPTPPIVPTPGGMMDLERKVDVLREEYKTADAAGQTADDWISAKLKKLGFPFRYRTDTTGYTLVPLNKPQ